MWSMCGGDPGVGQVPRRLLSQRDGHCFPRGRRKKKRLNAGIAQLVSGQERQDVERDYFQWPQFLSSQRCQAKPSYYYACSSLGLKIEPFSGLNLEEGMATHSSILAWRVPMDRGAPSYGLQGHKELDMTERLSRAQAQFSFERLSRLLSKALGLLFLGPVSRLWAAKFWVSPSAHPVPWNFN